mmetsp:Transcript_14757/g.24596  ORF Transcript_14757/g.24596 Transcript_14757/m.24596 type:complete len:203 (-) Transcript_14757:336-944(-)
MCLFPSDAKRMLQQVLKAPNGASSGARVLVSNLDRAFKLAQLEPTLSGLRDPTTSRELKMVWQFTPDRNEQRSAQSLLITTMRAPNVPNMPAYTINGLSYQKRGKEMRPIFLARKDLDAALDAAAESFEGNKLPKAEVVVIDLLEYLLQLTDGISYDTAATEAEIAEIDFVAPSDSIEYRDEIRNSKPKLKAKIVPPEHRWH